MKYANSELQQHLIMIASIAKITEEMATMSAFANVAGQLTQISTLADEIRDELLSDIDPESIQAIARRCLYQTLALVNRAKPLDGLYFVEENDMEQLIRLGAENTCLGCEKRGKDIRRCPQHRLFLRCGIATDKMDRQDDGCPFEW